MIVRRLSMLALMAALAACTTQNQTNPARSATEQMLISTAADRAAMDLPIDIPLGSKVFIDTTNFEGTDSKYAIGAIRTRVLRSDSSLVDDKKSADIVIEVRAGALSTDQNKFLIGIPAISIPVPFASSPAALPELALYSSEDQKGVAKFAITAYNAKTGILASAPLDPSYGFSHNTERTAFFLISWKTNDAEPKNDENDFTRDVKSVRKSVSLGSQESATINAPAAPAVPQK